MKDVNGTTIEDLLGAGWTEAQIKESSEYSCLYDEEKEAENQTQDVPDETSIFETAIQETISSNSTIKGVKEEMDEMKEQFNNTGQIIVLVDFSKPTTEVNIVIEATGQVDKAFASNHQLRLIHGRSYLVPVKCSKEVNSDNGNIKIFSDVSALLDVRYVKGGVACIIPLRHSITLNDLQRLCNIYNF